MASTNAYRGLINTMTTLGVWLSNVKLQIYPVGYGYQVVECNSIVFEM